VPDAVTAVPAVTAVADPVVIVPIVPGAVTAVAGGADPVVIVPVVPGAVAAVAAVAASDAPLVTVRVDVALAWQDNSEHEDGFVLERSGDGGMTWATVVTLAADVESYTDLNLVSGSTYLYRIKATSAALGDSEWATLTVVA